jgi:hypothetical protein
MGDEKSITGKLAVVISKAAGSVKSAVSHIVDTASEAAQHAMEANAEKISRIPAARPDPEGIAGATNEQLYIPETNDAAAMPMPLIPIAPEPKKKRAPKAAATKAKPNLSARVTPKYDYPAPTSRMPTLGKKKNKAAKKAMAKKTARKLANTAAKRSPGKKSSASAGKKSAGKNKKVVKKTGKKS